MKLNLNLSKTHASIKRRLAERRIKNLIRRYDFHGFKRIYHYHSRKTGGTSVAKTFLSLNQHDGSQLFTDLGRHPDKLLVVDRLIFAGWDKRLIEQGNYFFAFSHIPFEQIAIPDRTFCFTSFRDPIERVVSHYRMLVDFSLETAPHSCFATEGKWLGNSFDDFVDRIPREHLLNQLYMFSNCFSVAGAVERVRTLDHVMFLKNFGEGIQCLSKKTGLPLVARHDRGSSCSFEISSSQRQRLRRMLDDEYTFLGLVTNGVQKRSCA